MTGWWWVPVGAAGVAGAVLGVVLLTAGTDPTPDPVDGTPDEQAAMACARVELALQGVRADGAADAVLEEVGRARLLSRAAAEGDARWIALAGGVASLGDALRRDDGGAASIAVRVVRAECGGP